MESARNRLAELELEYGIEKAKVDSIRSKLFSLPFGVSSAPVKFTKDQSEITFTLTISADAKPAAAPEREVAGATPPVKPLSRLEQLRQNK